ncbi:MAG: DUF2304 domain-containing protein [Alicyclobacillus sp.]|nr:DUF2304 domain-containing protein [Alicyclobacillus sp.]
MQLYFVSIAFSLFFIFFVIELVRRGSLREQYSLLWLAFGVVMLVFSASTRLLRLVAGWFGVYYAPSLLFLFGLICAFALLLHVTVVISRLTDRVVRLTQELGISQLRIAELERQVAALAGLSAGSAPSHHQRDPAGGPKPAGGERPAHPSAGAEEGGR